MGWMQGSPEPLEERWEVVPAWLPVKLQVESSFVVLPFVMLQVV